jgi:hypothetical protein
VATGPKTSSYVQFHILSSPDGFLDPGQIAGAGADLRSSVNGFGLLWESKMIVPGSWFPGCSVLERIGVLACGTSSGTSRFR